jgi:hypothetical protein
VGKLARHILTITMPWEHPVAPIVVILAAQPDPLPHAVGWSWSPSSRYHHRRAVELTATPHAAARWRPRSCANSDGRGRAGGRRPLSVVFSVEVGSGKWGIEEDNKGMVDLDGSERAEMGR